MWHQVGLVCRAAVLRVPRPGPGRILDRSPFPVHSSVCLILVILRRCGNLYIFFTQRVKYIPKHGTIMHKCGRHVLVGRRGRPNSAHGRHDRQRARQERLDLSKSRILLNSRSHADNMSVTQNVSVLEFISIDEMLQARAMRSSPGGAL